MSHPAPAIALHLQGLLTHWPVPQVWHEIARLRAFPLRTPTGQTFARRDWPGACYIPIGVLEAWLHSQGYIHDPRVLASFPLDDEADDPLKAHGRMVSGFASACAFLARWRLGKGIYRFQPDLWEAVAATRLDPAIPVDVLHHLPEWAVIVETHGLTFDGYQVTAVGLHLDSLFPFTNDALLSIRLYCIGEVIYTRCLLLNEPTLGECLDQSENYAANHIKNSGFRAHELLPIISMALYLCARNRDIRDPEGREFSPPVPREVVAGKKGLKSFAAGRISQWNVGWRAGAALGQHARNESRRDELPSPPTGIPRKPHIRRAHWHLFWAGKGRTEPRVKWLPPTTVNVTKVTETIPTLHPVNKETP